MIEIKGVNGEVITFLMAIKNEMAIKKNRGESKIIVLICYPFAVYSWPVGQSFGSQ